MILLFTDFGWQGPYVGQLHLALAQEAPGSRVIDLMHDAPAFSPIAAGHLLSALVDRVPAEAVVVAVVDPGVGSARHPLLVEAAGRRFVGPDNGLLAPVAHRYEAVDVRIIEWRPPSLSASFHGRDLFAPAAARLVRGDEVATTPFPSPQMVGAGQPAWRPEVIYIDGYGNAWTGIPAGDLPTGAGIAVGGTLLPRARTFSDVERGQAFWYENSASLVEIAVRQGSAAERLGLRLGAPISISS